MTDSVKETSTATAAISPDPSAQPDTLTNNVATTVNSTAVTSINSTDKVGSTDGNANVTTSTTTTTVSSVGAEATESQAANSATVGEKATEEKISQEGPKETKKASKKRNRAGGPKVPLLINAKFLKQECDERELREALAFMKSKENGLIPNRPELGPLKKLSKDALIHYCPWAWANLYEVICKFREQKNQNAPVFTKTQNLLVRAFKQYSSKNIAIAFKSLGLDIKNLSSMKKDDVITAIVLHPQGDKVLDATLLLEDKQENEKKIGSVSSKLPLAGSGKSSAALACNKGTKCSKSNTGSRLIVPTKSHIKPKASQLHSGVHRPSRGAIVHPALLKKGIVYHEKIQQSASQPTVSASALPVTRKHPSEKELASPEELAETASDKVGFSESASLSDGVGFTDSANSSVSNSTASSASGKSEDLEQIAEYEDDGDEQEELEEQCAIDETTGIPLCNEEYLETNDAQDENMFLDEEGEEYEEEPESMYAEGEEEIGDEDVMDEEEDEVASQELSGDLDEDEEDDEQEEEDDQDMEGEEEEDSQDMEEDEEDDEEEEEEEQVPLPRSKKPKHAPGAAKKTKKVVKKKAQGKAQQQKKKKTTAKKQGVKKNKKSHTARKPKSASNRSRSHNTSRHHDR